MTDVPVEGLLFIASLLFVVPALIGRFVIREPWKMVGLAFLIWWAALLIFLGLDGPSFDEVLGWSVIMSMFLSIPGIAIILLGIKLWRKAQGR